MTNNLLLKKIVLFLSLVFCCFQGMAQTPLYSAVKVSDVGTTNNIGQANTSRNVAVDASGNIGVVYIGSAGLRFAKSVNRGQSFLPSVQLNALTTGNAEVQVADNGNIYVIYSNGSTLVLYISLDGGATFSAGNTLGSGSTPHIASYGSNVYVVTQNGSAVYRNANNGVGAFSSVSLGTWAFADIRVDKSNGDVYMIADNPTLFMFRSTNSGASFTSVSITGSVNFSSYTLTNGPLGKFIYVAGSNPTGFKINFATGTSTSFAVGTNAVSQGRTLESDEFGNFVDGYAVSSTSMGFHVSYQGGAYGTLVSIPNSVSHNLVRNSSTQDIDVVYQGSDGQIYLNTYPGMLRGLTTSNVNAFYCPGGTGTVTYSATGGTINAGNNFIVQLSDANRSFANPVTIGTLASTATSGTINFTIPANTPSGSQYRIRVISTNQATTGADNLFDISINTPPVATITTSGATTICQGNPVLLASSTGSSYLWSNGATTSSISVNDPGAYTVTVGNGCGSFATSAPTTVNVTLKPTITASGPLTFCTPGTVTLTASAGTTYLWSNNATTSSINVSASGTYTVKVTGGGCAITSDPVTVVDHDNVKPVPNVTTLPTITGTCSVTLTAPTATDNCSGTITATTVNPVSYATPGVYTVTWSYDDSHGNIATQTQRVVVNASAPVINCVPDIAVSNGTQPVLFASYPLLTDLHEATGHFGDFALQGTGFAAPNDGMCQNGIYSFGDPNGQNMKTDYLTGLNTSNFEIDVDFKLSALGKDMPVIIGGSGWRWIAIYVKSDGTMGVKYNNNFFEYSTTQVTTATWYTGKLVYTNGKVELFLNGTSILSKNIGSLITGNDLNFHTTDFSSAGVLNGCIRNLNIFNIVPATCSVVVNYATPTASSQCGTVTVVQTAGLPSGSSFPVGITTNTFKATDAAGNFTTCSFNVTVTDNELPVIAQPSAISVNNDATACGATIAVTAPAATDNCPGVTVTGVRSDALALNALYPVGTTTITWTATDAHNNIVTVTQTITVTDNELPKIIVSANQTLPTTPGDCGAIVTIAPPVVSDNCQVQSVTNNFNGTGDASGHFNPGPTTITWTVTDIHGNINTATQTITVIDNESPVAIGQDVTVYLDATGHATLTADQVDNGSTDNCSIATKTLSKTDFDCSNTIRVTPNKSALNFDGIDDWVQIGGTIPAGNTFTFSTWFYPTNGNNGKIISSSSLEICVCSGAIEVYTPIGNSFGAFGLAMNTWHHIAVTFNGSLANVYIDGQVSFSFATAGALAPLTGARLGAHAFVNCCRFPGMMDEVSTWNVALSQSDITKMQTQTLSGTEPGLTGYWNFDENTGNIAVDHSGNGHDGTLTNMTGNPWVSTTAPVSGNSGGATTTLFVTDVNGNQSSVTVNVTVLDQIAPVITCPANISVNNDPNTCGAVVVITNATATDNCVVADITGVRSDALALTSAYPIGSTTILWTATDASGNQSTCTQTVTVTDNQPPVIICQNNITTNAAGPSGAVVNYTVPVGTDNCSGVTTAMTGGLASGSTFPIGTTKVTYTATDAAGLSTSCSFNVVITGLRPVIVPPHNISVNADNGQCGAVVNFAATETTAIPASTITYSIQPGSLFPIGTTTVTATATNAVGNSVATFTVTVIDNQPPVIVCAAPVTVNNIVNTCAANVVIPAPVITDNCNIVTHTDDLNSYTLGNVSGQSPQWAPWPGGNSAEVSAEQFFSAPYSLKVTGVPAGGPVDQIFRLGNQTTGDWIVTFKMFVSPGHTAYYNLQKTEALNDWAHQVSFRSNGTAVLQAAGTSVVVNYPQGQWFEVKQLINQNTDQTSLFINGVFVKTWQYSRNLSNVAGVNKIGGFDFFPVTNGLVSDPNPAATPLFYVDDISLTGNVAQIGTYISRRYSKSYPVGQTLVTIKVNDVSGNTVSCVQEINVVDAQIPVIAPVANISRNNDAGKCGATVAITAPATSDNCGVGAATGVRGDGLSLTDSYPVGSTTITWTVTDMHGNNAIPVTQTIVVTDNELPVITSNGNKSVNNDAGKCGAVVAVSATATDNCGVGAASGVRGDGLALTDPYPVGSTTITWTVTDMHGNNAIPVTQTIVVTDNELPVITSNGNISVNNDAGKCGAVVAVSASATDNCGVGTPSGVRGDGLALTDPYPVGTTTITWTVTDIHGNSNTSTQVIVVTDNEKPVITSNGNKSVNNDAGKCGALVTVSATAMDNCGVGTPSGVRGDGLALTALYPLGTTTITWTVTDSHGNSNTSTQTVTVTDTEKPVIVSNGNKTVNNDLGKCGATVSVSAITTDNCGVVAATGVRSDGLALTALYPVGTTTITWTVTDTHTNTAIPVTQTVVVTDNEAPVITCPADAVFCANYGGVTNYTIASLIAADNCGIQSTSFAVSGATTRSGTGTNASGVFAVGVSTITWTVKDTHGNTSVCSTKVTINPLPVATYVTTNADAFCNKTTLTASSSINAASYSWTTGSTPGSFVTNPDLVLGLTNNDGTYNVFVKVNATGCVSEFPVGYNFQKQNLASAYTILAYKEVELGKYNKVQTGSVGVMTAKGEAEFNSYSAVNGPGAFVKAPKIDKDGSGILITTPIIGIANVTLPTMQYNTASTNTLPNYTATVNGATIAGNYKNFTVKKGMSVTVTGNTFSSIRLEEGASIKFTAAVLNIDNLSADRGSKNINYSYIRFTSANTAVRVSGYVSIGSQVLVNPEANKVTFYMGDLRNDEEKFTVKGADIKVIANVIMPDGKIRVTSTDSDRDDYDTCDHKAHDARNCPHRGHDHNDCDHKAHSVASCNDDVYMTGLYIGEEVESKGNTVFWNSYDCSAPVPVYTTTSVNTATNAKVESKETIATTEEELKVTVMPNPSTTFFTLKLESKYATPVDMRVMDGNGRVIDAKSKIGSNSTIQIGSNYSSGTYYAELIQGTQRKVVQLIKAKG